MAVDALFHCTWHTQELRESMGSDHATAYAECRVIVVDSTWWQAQGETNECEGYNTVISLCPRSNRHSSTSLTHTQLEAHTGLRRSMIPT